MLKIPKNPFLWNFFGNFTACGAHTAIAATFQTPSQKYSGSSDSGTPDTRLKPTTRNGR